MAQVRFWRPKRPHLEKSHVVWQCSHHGTRNCGLFDEYHFLIFYAFHGSKGRVFWVKKRCFGVFWTGCEVADLKQRQGITTMDHRNKIQSLVLPTDDPGDAPDCITEYGPLPVNMAIYAINQPIFRTSDFPSKASLLLIPVSTCNTYWHLMVADRNRKVIHYFDPLHLQRRSSRAEGEPDRSCQQA